MVEKESIMVFDTLTMQYVTVDVSGDVAQEVRRSHWREAQQEHRYYKRMIPLDDYYLKTEDVYTDEHLMVDSLIREYAIECLIEAIKDLPRKQQEMVDLVYYREFTMSQAALQLGVSVSYISRQLKDARKVLELALRKNMDD